MNNAVLRPVIAVSLLAALTGCWFSERIEEFGGPTMGSTYSIKYVRSDGAPSLDQLKHETDAILSEVDQQMSTYRDDSLIEQFNQAPAGTCQTMPAPVLELVEAGRILNEQSQGAFDLTLEPLLNLWGFGPQGRAEQVPTAEQLAAARARTGMQYLRRDGQQLCKEINLQVDFNSIAAGYTVDRIAQRLTELGVKSYLVEVTGELKAAGIKPDGQPWRIGLEAPQEGERVAQRILALDGYGISTSGDYRNYFEENGRRYSHTLDPLTAAPITHTLAAVTVADKSTLRADGLSTLLMVMGTERGLVFAERMGIAAFFVTREGDAFVTQGTQAFEQLFAAGEEQ
ncbi:thiamine biosynthesis protein ApbE [Pseudomonas sp. HMWF032]|uniref:FAD:protein FMN transferase n=1 Tax=unclassified Pseudomonas TaxID=196821 RepID=UPI000D392F47|nr:MULTISPECIES: FAD:protein FMN transferase [unclassified Pseudomonas]PTS83489.1 thiamine biosynthesis protein ApbE [Pseudomonas sp. HMWF032]PTT83335.1 thiamine biosynthesis protein ApbE [Pseudomonas sp. HMWF010]WAC44720.1 FAD:protein FMN transferase [Pseudomonas sp. SL4(2022)]